MAGIFFLVFFLRPLPTLHYPLLCNSGQTPLLSNHWVWRGMGFGRTELVPWTEHRGTDGCSRARSKQVGNSRAFFLHDIFTVQFLQTPIIKNDIY